MKKITYIAISMLGALSLAGCQKDVADHTTAPGAEPQNIKISLSAAGSGVGLDTRTIIEGDKTTGFTSAWHIGDKLGVYAYYDGVDYGYRTDNAEFVITSIDDNAATFEGEIKYDGSEHTYELYAYTPRVDGINTGSHTSVEFLTVESTQTMRSNNAHDDNNDFMMAVPGQKITVSGSGQITATELDNIEFQYIVGFMNLQIADILADGVSADEAVVNVKVTGTGGAAGEPVISGSFNLDLTNGNRNYPFSPSNDITVLLPDVESADAVTLGELSAWIITLPFEADELTFVVTTTDHTIEKTVTAAQLGGTFSIEAGNIKTFNLTVDDNCTIGDNKPVEFIYASHGVTAEGYYGDLRHTALTFRSYDAGGYWEGIALNMQVLALIDDSSSIEYLDFPEGTYNFNNSLADKSITLGGQETYIMYYENDKYVGRYTVTGGTMIVEGDHTNYNMTFEIITLEAGPIRATWNGPLSIENPNYIPPARKIELGELTGVLSVQHMPNIWGAPYNVDGWEFAIGNAGTFLEYGNYKGTGWVFQVFMHSPMVNEGDPLPDGTYEIKQAYDPYTALPGAWGRTDNAWIIDYQYSSIVEELPLTSGTITSKFEDGLYKMEINVKTINGDIVTGTVNADPTVVPVA